MRKFATIFMAVMLVLSVGLLAAPARADTGGEDDDRWVSMEVSNTNYTSTANITFPEEIAEEHTLNGELKHNITNPADNDVATTNWVNITFENSTGVSDSNWTVSSGPIDVSANETVDFSMETDLPTGNYTANFTLVNDDSQLNDTPQDIEVTVLSNMVYTISGMMMPLVIAISVFVISLTLIKGVAKIFSGVGDDM